MKQKDNITDMAMLLKDSFETYLLKERGVSNHTIRSYSATFQSLYAFFKDNKGIRANKLFVKDLSRRSINDYLNWLEMEKGNKVSTRNSRLASVKAFCHYAQYKDLKNLARWQDILSIKSKKADMPYMSFLTQEGMKTLLSEVQPIQYKVDGILPFWPSCMIPALGPMNLSRSLHTILI